MFRILLIAIAAVILPLDVRAERVALVIGNGAYSDVAELDNPANDAKAVSAALEEQGFRVFRRDDLDRSAFYDALREFRDVADSAEIAMVYYAGHGIEIDGQNYLMPIDARLEDERDASVEMITVDVVLRQISGADVMKMVVLDACRNNPFLTRMKREGVTRSAARAGLGRIETSEADTLIAYAAAAGEITPDGESGGNSPFSEAFVKAMSGPPTDVRRLLGTVRDELRQTVPGAAPFVYSSLGGGEYVINPNSARPEPPKPEPEPQPTQVDSPIDLTETIITDFLEADRLASLTTWNHFLGKYRTLNYHLLYARALENREALLLGTGAEGHTRSTTSSASEAETMQTLPAVPAVQEPQVAMLTPADDAPSTVPDTVAVDPAVAAAALLPQDRRAAAEMVQELLRERGCYSGGIDGDLGPGSQRGIAAISEETGEAFEADRDSDVATLQKTILSLQALPSEVACPEVQRAQRTAPPPRVRTPPRTTSPAPVRVQPAPPKPVVVPAKPRTTAKDCRQC